MDGPSGRRPSPEVMENLAYLGSPGSRFSDDDDYQNSSTSVIRGNSLFFGRANNNGSTGLVAPNSLLGRLSAFRGPAKDSLAPPQDNRRRGSPDSNSPMINRSHAGGRASMESSYSDLPAPQMSYAGRQYSSEIPDLTLPELPGTRDTAFSSVTPDYTQLSKLEEREKMVAGERMRMKAAMDKAWASPSNHSSLQRFSLFPPPTKNPPPNSLLRAKSADTRLSGEGRLTPDLRPRGLSLERIATRRASRATINGSPEAEMLSPTPEADAPEGSEQALRRPPAGGRILTFAESEHQARRSNHHPHVRSTARPPPHDRVSKAMSKSSEYSHYESPTLPRSSWSIFWGPDQRDTGIAL
ncbi:MAG: hypothetical protein M1829_004994 [Trizodia sp. TS-e1964]|nr:MAG: hypothetical protein M1829_004994 [Trizodia sp. TS-e1964]